MWIPLLVTAFIFSWYSRHIEYKHNGSHLLTLALINLLFTPLYEELVFRYAMRHLFPGDYAWLIISLVFALCHVPNYLVVPHPNVLVHQIFLLLFGIQLWQYSLRDSILIHYAWNICMGLLRYGLTRWYPLPVATVSSSITTVMPKKHCIYKRSRSTDDLQRFGGIKLSSSQHG